MAITAQELVVHYPARRVGFYSTVSTLYSKKINWGFIQTKIQLIYGATPLDERFFVGLAGAGHMLRRGRWDNRRDDNELSQGEVGGVIAETNQTQRWLGLLQKGDFVS